MKELILFLIAAASLFYLSWYQGYEIDVMSIEIKKQKEELKRYRDIHYEAMIREFCYQEENRSFCLRAMEN